MCPSQQQDSEQPHPQQLQPAYSPPRSDISIGAWAFCCAKVISNISVKRTEEMERNDTSEEKKWKGDAERSTYRLRGLDAVLSNHGFLRGGLGLALVLSRVGGGERRHGDCWCGEGGKSGQMCDRSR